jgi:hypothetical protein
VFGPDPKDASRWWAIMLIMALVVCMFYAVKGSAEEGHEGHEQYHVYYERWMMPDHPQVSCCHARRKEPVGEGGQMTIIGDCYPTEFKLVDGEWWALLDPETNGGKREFVRPPENKRLREKNPDPSGVSGHLCEGVNHEIYCWVSPTGSL